MVASDCLASSSSEAVPSCRPGQPDEEQPARASGNRATGQEGQTGARQKHRKSSGQRDRAAHVRGMMTRGGGCQCAEGREGLEGRESREGWESRESREGREIQEGWEGRKGWLRCLRVGRTRSAFLGVVWSVV